MSATPDDGQQNSLIPVRLGRVVLMPSGSELVVGKALNARSAVASHHVPPMTVRRFPRIVFDPAPPHKALAYAGGGEASALADIAELKRHGRVSMAPDYDLPDPVLEAVTMDEVRQAGDPNYNRFRGFHGDHAYAAFHPSDVRGHGVFTPDMVIAPDLVMAGAQGFLAAGAAMMLPTVAVFFAVGTAVTEDAYAAGARAIRKHCTGLAMYLSAAAKWHQSANVGRKPTERLATKSFDPVVEVVRQARTFDALVKLVDAAGDAREAGGKRAAATVLMLAATYYPAVLNEYGKMIDEYIEWREEKDEGERKPEKFLTEAVGAAQAARRAATLTICGYIFMPDSDGIGVTGVYQLSGEGIRYGEFDVLPLNGRGFQHGVLAVGNNLAGGLIGYRVRGHAAHTLKMAHRIIMRDAVKTVFGDTADWARPEAARAWLPRPEEMWLVQRCSARELVLQRKDADEEELVLEMAVHTCASSSDCTGTVVPLVFSPTNELVFERFTRCTRGAVGTERELHGAQLLRAGDEVTIWTTPSAEDSESMCLVAARCWSLECALIPNADGLQGLAFDIVDSGTSELPTPLEVVNAVIAFGVVHRQPSTVIPYLFSPTKTGGETTPGQGVGKTEWLRRSLAAVGPNLVDMVNDHDRLVKNDQFNDKGHTSIFTLIDDVEKPDFLMHGATKAAATAKENEARVKCKGNKKSDNYNTTICTANQYISKDAAEKAEEDQARRMAIIRAWSTMVGRVLWFAYIYGTYFNVSPLIQKCILQYWRTLPGVDTRGPGDLQALAKRGKAHWSGQVPMHVGFLQKLYEAPRMASAQKKQAQATANLTSKAFTLLSAVDEALTAASEKEFLAAAKHYVQENYDTGARNPGRVRENAQLIVEALKKAAEAGEGAVWNKLYHLGLPDGQQHKQMCFSVERKVLKDVVEACGYRVYDPAVSEDAPTWPPAAEPEREDGDGVEV